jgi:hypothetical protein
MKNDRRWKRVVIAADQEVLNRWITLHQKNWFDNPKNSFYGYEDRARAIAEYWLDNGKFGPDYDDPNIIMLQSYWKDWVTEVWQEINKGAEK